MLGLFWFGCEAFERYAAIVLRTTHKAVYCSASVRASRKTEVAFRRRRVGMEVGRSGRCSRKAARTATPRPPLSPLI